MSGGNEIGIELGQLLTRYGLSKLEQRDEDERWERRRQRQLELDNEAERARLRRDAQLKRPETYTREEVDPDGRRFKSEYQWRIDPKTMTGREVATGYREPLMMDAPILNRVIRENRIDTEQFDPATGESKVIATGPRYKSNDGGAADPLRQFMEALPEDERTRAMRIKAGLEPRPTKPTDPKEDQGFTLAQATSRAQAEISDTDMDQPQRLAYVDMRLKEMGFDPKSGKRFTVAQQKEREQAGSAVDAFNKYMNDQGGAPSGSDSPADEQGAAAAGGPKIGDVIDGWKFKGGDPGNPNSWEKAGL